MTKLTELDLAENRIADILPLDGLTSLAHLELPANQIVSLAPLAGLTKLTELDLAENQIADILPLASLTNLTELVLSWNRLTDLAPLADLTNLVVLGLSLNQIADITPLAGLASLRTLELGENAIADIIPLAGLTSLTYLWLEENQITDITALTGLTSLTALYLSENQIADIAPLAGLVSLESLHLSRNRIVGLAPLAGLANLHYLNLSENRIADITSLAGLTRLWSLYLRGNQIADVSPAAGLGPLGHLDVGDNRIATITPLAGLNLLYLWVDENYLYLGPGSSAMEVIAPLLAAGTFVDYLRQHEPGDAMEIAYDMGSFGDSAVHRLASQEISDGPFGPADVDLYRITLAQVGTLIVDVDAASSGSALDAQLRLFSDAGVELASNGNPNGLDPYFSPVLSAGTYYVGVSGQPNAAYDPAAAGSGAPSATAGAYEVRISQAPTLTWDGTSRDDWTSAHWNPGPVAPGGGEAMVVDSGTVIVASDLTTTPGAAALVDIARNAAGGAVSIGPAGRLAVTGEVNVGAGGLLSIDGRLAADKINVAGGWLTNSRSSTGDLDVEGDVTLGRGARYVIDVVNGGADALAASGAVALGPDASLEIVIVGGGKEFRSGTYTLIEAGGGLTGTFTDVTDLGAYVSVNGNGLTYNQAAGTVTVTLDMNLNPADANLDGATDVLDRIIWNTYNFTTGTTFVTGDFNDDGVTDVLDRIIWNNNNFTMASAAPAPQTATPAMMACVSPDNPADMRAFPAVPIMLPIRTERDSPASRANTEPATTVALVGIQTSSLGIPNATASFPPQMQSTGMVHPAETDASADARIEPDMTIHLADILGEQLAEAIEVE